MANRQGRRLSKRRLVRLTLVLGALVSCGVALQTQGGKIADTLGRLSVARLVLAESLVVVAALATMLSWRAVLTDLGSRLPLRASGRIFFLSQLGKYLPGSVWPVVGQVDLGRDHRVPARRSAVVAVITLAVSMTTGLLLAASTLPFSTPEALRRYAWAFMVVPVMLIALHPRVLNPLLHMLFRIVRRPPPGDRMSLSGVSAAAGWALVAWLAYGLQIAVLVGDLGRSTSAHVVTAVGAFALAWTVGFLVLLAPAGAGVREAVLVLTLSPVLPAARALAVALVSRVLLSSVDLALAGVAVLLERWRQEERPTATPEAAAAAVPPNS